LSQRTRRSHSPGSAVASPVAPIRAAPPRPEVTTKPPPGVAALIAARTGHGHQPPIGAAGRAAGIMIHRAPQRHIRVQRREAGILAHRDQRLAVVARTFMLHGDEHRAIGQRQVPQRQQAP
jgi:hypothetical protein